MYVVLGKYTFMSSQYDIQGQQQDSCGARKHSKFNHLNNDVNRLTLVVFEEHHIVRGHDIAPVCSSPVTTS